MKDFKLNLKPGDRIVVPWGLKTVEGSVVEVWGTPAAHVRVALELGGPESPEDIVTILLSPSLIELAKPA